MIRNFLALIAALLIGAAPVAAQTISGPTQPVFPLLAPDGSAAAPSYSFASDPNTGLYSAAADAIGVTTGGTGRLSMSANGILLRADGLLRWTSNTITSGVDTAIARAAAGSFTFSNAGANTFTVTAGASGLATFGASVVATGNVFATDFIAGQGNNIYWNGRVILSSPSTDSIRIRNNALTNSVDLTVGASNLLTLNGGLTTAGSIVSGGVLQIAAAGDIRFGTGQTRIISPADGVLRLSNAALTGFSRLQFGGTTNLFGSIKASGAALQARLADDSGDTAFTASTVQTVTGYSAAGTALPTCNAGAAGTRAYVTDATAPTFLGAYVSGGAVVSPVFCTGAGGWVTGANDNFAPMEMAG